VHAPDVRFRVDPADVPPEKVARRLHLTPAQFVAVQQKLFARGFPPPDPTTGNYCLEAVDRWRKLRPGNSHLFPELTSPGAPNQGPMRSMGERFRETQKRKRNG
jgi:hypothetical protein